MYEFYFVPLHSNGYNQLFFLIEHLKRLPVMGGRFFRSFAEAEMGVIKANTGIFTGILSKRKMLNS